MSGYGTGQFAPGIRGSGLYDYISAHTLLKAHAKTYRMYQKDFAKSQKGSYRPVDEKMMIYWLKVKVDQFLSLKYGEKYWVQFSFSRENRS